MQTSSANFLFSGLSDEQVRRVERLQHRAMYRAGQTVYAQGDLGEHFYIIDDGTIEFVVRDAGALSYTAQTMTSGECFGMAALLDDVVRMASAVAIQETMIRSLSRESFARLCQDDPQMGYTMMRNLAVSLSSMLLQRSYQPSVA